LLATASTREEVVCATGQSWKVLRPFYIQGPQQGRFDDRQCASGSGAADQFDAWVSAEVNDHKGLLPR